VLERIIHFSIRQRLFVLLATLGLIGVGVYSFQRLPIDALPDITNVQVQINSEAPGYSPLEVEQRITYPVETTLAGLPYLLETRSISRYGLSQVTVVFEEGTDIYFARQLINSRLQEVKQQLPAGIQPIMGPIATGLGEIFMWSLEWDESHLRLKDPFEAAVELRTVQDWIIRPQLRTVPGVAEVNSIGGYVKQYQVAPDPEKLMAFDITFRDVMDALEKNNANVGAGYLEHKGEQYLIRAPGQVVSKEEIANIVIGSHRGVPIHIHDVAEVQIAKELRTGAATKNGRETVLGTVFMLKGENSRIVSLRVAKKMEEINNTLPEGIHANVVYDRTKLVNATLQTVRDNLAEGALFVILVLFLLLGNFRAALITALVIPLSMLFAVSGMVSNKISGNLLSLGAIDFGIIIDSAVIIVENCIRRMALEQKRLQRELKPEERHFIVQEAAVEVSRPSIFGVFIIMIVYLPILTLTGIEGKMFQPMAFTVLAALSGALILSLTFVPAMVAQFTTGRVSEKKNYILEMARKAYAPLLNISLNNRTAVITLAGVLVALSLLMGTRLGAEFIPTLDEKDMAVHALRIPGTGLDQAASMQHTLEKEISEFPEVDYVFAKIGTAEIATDPMPPSVADVFVMMLPRSQWPNAKKSRTELVAEMEQKLIALPGNKYEFTQPIQMRFNELIAGVRSDVAVKVHGDNLDILLEEAKRISHVLETVPGATDVRVEQVTGLPVLTIQLNREEMARLGLNVADVQDVIEIAIGGKQAGQVFQGDRRFDLIVRLPDDTRKDIALLKRIPLPYPEGLTGTVRPAANLSLSSGKPLPAFITLGTVADFKVIKGPNQISRENGKRRVVVTANVRGRDLGSFVEQAQERIQNKISLPSGYWTTWGGTFEHLISATQRLYVVVPVALLLIFLMLFVAFGSTQQALIIFTGVPLAWTGGIISLWIRGIPLSISAAVGFIALSGVAVLNGVVMISFINKLREDGIDLNPAVVEGSLTRLRPVLMTALVASLGFLPMALATGTGAEVQRPLATVVIGGILSSTALTLFVLPALYQALHKTKQH
jgi:cobalt-zinc-cadmium resistance protein CzcA